MIDVSIIIPTRNSSQYIRETLDSLKNQSAGGIELIFVDGGSSDDTLEIVEEFQWSTKRVVHCLHEGVPEALNLGFDIAAGKYLAWLNSDDVIVCKNSITRILDCFNASLSDVVISHSIVIDENSKLITPLIAFLPNSVMRRQNTNIFTGSIFFSRAAWSRFGGFSGIYKLSFESELIRFLLEQEKVSLLNFFVGGFRVHPNGLSSRFSEELSRERDEIFRGVKKERFLSACIHRAFSHIKNKSIGFMVKSLFLKWRGRGVKWRFLDLND